ncbi:MULTISPECIES: hypothetical protein [unclassified Bacillus (in: firmicutes)]|uniref:hypothetical protein n=1 Tax=unclassified Bacillus (in: firmicutes) TaxID=185979 RepID=UPI000BF07B5E|nr:MULTISPECIES: hypothetical protein [unclassified Bacillus (in: firmicutes)]PEJ48467.1 hypothetical protein CN692_23705 [Bacillus sp. AFS002410]PEK98886.1 hypothetical protein CN601_24660 [Bacillus sp. AFS017336]
MKCDLTGFGLGIFLVLLGGMFLFINTKGKSNIIKILSIFSLEGGALLLGLLIALLSILQLLGVGQGTCKSSLFN